MELDKLNKVANGLKGLNGCFLVGKIEGIDFVSSGKMETGQVYGSSIKLKFTQVVNTYKMAGTVLVPTTKLHTVIVKVAVDDSKLIEEITKYNKLLNKEVLINLQLPDNNTFSTDSVHELV